MRWPMIDINHGIIWDMPRFVKGFWAKKILRREDLKDYRSNVRRYGVQAAADGQPAQLPPDGQAGASAFFPWL